MQFSTVLLLYCIFMLTFTILIALFMEKSKGELFSQINLGSGAIVIAFSCLQFTILYLYLFDFFVKFNFELLHFLMGWFIFAGIGCAVSFSLFVRRQLLPIAVIVLLMSYTMIGFGVMMKYLNSM